MANYRKGAASMHGNGRELMPTIRTRPKVVNRIDPNSPGPVAVIREIARLGYRLIPLVNDGPRPTA